METILYILIVYSFLLRVNSVEILDSKPKIKECHGTHVGFGFSGNLESHYNALVTKYKGCTHVEGNLEITNFYTSTNITYDMSFLSDIEVVTGYVLLGLLEVDTIPLVNLRLIRADNTYNIKNMEYGLIVAITSAGEPDDPDDEVVGLRELQLPNLKEISRGKVLFKNNPNLRYVDTIDWHAIVPGEKEPVTYGAQAYCSNCTSECDISCLTEGLPRCWGHNYKMCQKVQSMKCDPSSTCPGRCYMLGCCHPECAVGCFGPFETDCIMCKYFKHDGRCVSLCPTETTYREGQFCMDIPFFKDP